MKMDQKTKTVTETIDDAGQVVGRFSVGSYLPDIDKQIKTVEDGFVVVIQIDPDSGTRPEDYDCYDREDVESWERGEWCFVSILVSVWLKGVKLSTVAITGVDFKNTQEGGDYFAERMDDLKREALWGARGKLAELATELVNLYKESTKGAD
jgi:hypothetical protein